MSAWSRLKRILNKEKYISRNKLIKEAKNSSIINRLTVSNYIRILRDIGYIENIWEHLSKYESITVPYCKLIRKIPEKLTVADAKKIKHMPWLAWFKYAE